MKQWQYLQKFHAIYKIQRLTKTLLLLISIKSTSTIVRQIRRNNEIKQWLSDGRRRTTIATRRRVVSRRWALFISSIDWKKSPETNHNGTWMVLLKNELVKL